MIIGLHCMLHLVDNSQEIHSIFADCFVTEPIGGDISILAETDVAEKQLGTRAEKRLLEKLQSQREALSLGTGAADGVESKLTRQDSGKEGQKGGESSSGRCFYTPLPHLIKTSGLSPSELTTLNLDKVGKCFLKSTVCMRRS